MVNSREARLDFATDDKTTGFRLDHFEWYNWGTFDGAIYRLDTLRQNALLTGEIGSGKSTIVDALTTLLVPHRRIVYNKAAGAESRERSLLSYIAGEYKSVKDDTFGSAKAATLRDPKETFTVLLARFENEGFDEHITLAQFFYIANKQVQKFYITSRGELDIRKDFFDFKEIRELKKRLKKLPHTHLYESFKEYSRDFRRVMGIKNEQALNLFYQTVSMKSIGNLTGFIRNHMLEAGEINAQVDELCHNFSELNRAHNLILEAQKQIDLLKPIDREAAQYEKYAEKRQELDTMRSLLGAYFAEHKVGLLESKLAELNLEHEKSRSKKRVAEEEAERLYEEVLNLKMELQRNGADRLSHIDSEILRLQGVMQGRQKEKEKYDTLSKRLELPTVSSEHRFLKNREAAQEQLQSIDTKTMALQNDKVQNSVLIQRSDEEAQSLENEIAYLKKRRSNIPRQTARIRDAMAQTLGLKSSDLPFAGELIRVTNGDWEGAIERILHSFALSLIVDVQHYEAVSRYVEKTQLGGKLVYLKVDRAAHPRLPDETASDSLLQKIEVKADSAFAHSIDAMLYERFDIPCVDSLEAFRRQKRALTIHGQFKTSLVRHEKDDRYRIDDRTRWVLGWENEKKLRLLQSDYESVRQKRDMLQEQNRETDQTLTTLTATRDSLRDLLSCESYESIEWYRPSRQIEELTDEKRQLEESSDIIRALQEKLEVYEKRRRQMREEAATLENRLGKLEQSIEERELERNGAMLLVENSETLPQFREVIDRYAANIFKEMPTLVTIGARESRLRKQITAEIDTLDKRIARSREKTVADMKEFVNAFPVVAKEFDASVEAVEEYRKKLTELKRDNLPKWRKRFKSLLKEKMVQHILVLQNKLEYQSEEIRSKIEAINRSLHDIEYNDGTYIELIAEPVKSIQIREFKESLKAAVSGAIGEDNSYDEQKFLQIKSIIERFNGREGYSDEDKKWRAAVTDVRNWFDFSAAERYISDGSEKEYYTDSGGKSGGQKEKLAYTVLASSLAFQFGLEHHRIKSRSFRFVMIDEAFGRGSDESTRYGLQLFEKLNLQLLVITPKQKINVIEPYVETVHFVHNRDGMESTLISMKIEDFRKNKDESSAAPATQAKR